MGWTGIPNFDGGVKEQIQEVTAGYDVLKAQKVGSVIYAAVRDEKSGEVWCLITLTDTNPRYHEFLYKSMSDSSGPHATSCPTSILDLLTETDDPYATRWRAKAREVAAIKARKLNKGDTIKIDEPIRFEGGDSFDTFRFLRQYSFLATDEAGNKTLVRLPKNWKTRYRWEMIEPSAQ